MVFFLLPVAALAEEDCVDCHAKVTPNVVLDWQLSKHSKTEPLSVRCCECHGHDHFAADYADKAHIPGLANKTFPYSSWIWARSRSRKAREGSGEITYSAKGLRQIARTHPDCFVYVGISKTVTTVNPAPVRRTFSTILISRIERHALCASSD